MSRLAEAGEPAAEAGTMDHEELLRDIAALGEEFDRLGGRLGEAAHALRDQGTAPSARLLDDIAAARIAFQRLRARVVELAGPEHAALAERGDLDSLRSLLAVLHDLTARQQRHAALEQARSAALVVLDRVGALSHREEPAFPPLEACRASAATLRRAVADAAELHPDVEPLVTGAHPLAALVTLVHRLADLQDQEFERLGETVTAAFGRAVGLAATRGKLGFGPERATPPGAAPAAASAERWHDEVDEVARALGGETGLADATAPIATVEMPAAAPIAAAVPPPPPPVVPPPAPPPAAPVVPPPPPVPPPAPAPVAAVAVPVAAAPPSPPPSAVDTTLVGVAAPAPAAAAPPSPSPSAVDTMVGVAAPAPVVAVAPPDLIAPDGEEPEEEPVATPAAPVEPTASAAAQAAIAEGLAALGGRGAATPPAGISSLAAAREAAGELVDFAGDVRRLRYFHAVAVGAGAALAVPRAFAGPFPSKLGYPELTLLDSLDPATIRRTLGHLDLLHTLFLVYAGAELPPETMALYRYCREQAEHALPSAGKQFVAITHAGAPLEALAQEQQFRRTFLVPPDLRDARAALSWAGLVPAALIGVNLAAFLTRAQEMASRCAEAAPADNPGVTLGAMLATLARAGRNKVTFVLPAPLDAFGAWAEPLLATVRRRDGAGLVPIVGEGVGSPAHYGPDRVFVALTMGADGADTEARLQALEVVGHPVYRIGLRDPLDLAAEMARWQMAAAVAGALLDVPAEPAPRKEASARFGRRIGEGRPTVQEGGLRLFTDPPGKVASVAEGLSAHFVHAKAGGSVTLLPYLPSDTEAGTLLNALRTVLRDRLKLATRMGRSLGYLQAAGEPAAGGEGLYLQITSDDRDDVPVPGERQTFGGLKRSQALADFQTLREAGRAVVRIHLDGVPAAGLRRLNEMVARALAATR